MTIDAIEKTEQLQQLLNEYAKDLDSSIVIRMRRRDWMTLAVLWWYFGGSEQMETALGYASDNGEYYRGISLPFKPCMTTNCKHGPSCGSERDALETTLLKFLERSDSD